MPLDVPARNQQGVNSMNEYSHDGSEQIDTKYDRDTVIKGVGNFGD